MARQRLDTSITDDRARTFLAEAEERATLYCDKQSGLHLLKTKKGGSWRYRYTDDTGKRRTATVGRYPGTKPQQAAEQVIEWRGAKTDPLKNKQERRRAAISEAEAAEQRTMRAYIEGGYTRYASGETLAILRHNFAAWLDRDMATLAQRDVRSWQDQRENEGRAFPTLQRAYGALRTMLNRATNEDGILSENPLAKVQLREPRNTERDEELRQRREATRRLLTDKEMAGLYAGLDAFAEETRQQRRNSRGHGRSYLPDLDAVAYPHWFIPFAYAGLYTGLRPGDLYTLTWAELNPNFGRLVKVPNKTKHNRNPARVQMDMPPQLLEIMQAWWKQQGRPTAGLVFPSPITGRKMDKNAHSKAWRRVKRLGGLPDDLVFYALRHHFISTLVKAGVPLLTVANLAGHKSAGMIEHHYGHLCPEAARGIMAQYGRTIAQAREATG